jgi:crossover junction endodeoxyribonuclease RuvC
MKLAQARGAMLAALTQLGRPIQEYPPTSIKSVVAGHGGTDKTGVQKLLRLHLGPIEFETHDESDALAIAFCHLVTRSGIRLVPMAKSNIKKSRGLADALQHRIKEQQA